VIRSKEKERERERKWGGERGRGAGEDDPSDIVKIYNNYNNNDNSIIIKQDKVSVMIFQRVVITYIT
jgi:hypothetical protein